MKKILVLDDEIEMNFIFDVMFEDEIEAHQIDIDFFSSPQECVEHMSHTGKKYDYILSDINMPQINGIQFVRKLRDQGYDGKIALMSAYQKDDFEDDMKKLGINSFFSKPVDFQKLKQMIQNL